MKSPKVIIAVCRRSGAAEEYGMEKPSLSAGFFQRGNFFGRYCNGGGRWGEACFRIWSRRSLDRETLDADFAASVNCHQRCHRHRIQTLSGEILNDLKSLVRSVRVLIRTISR